MLCIDAARPNKMLVSDVIRMFICLENLELLQNLTAVREISVNSGRKKEKFCQEKISVWGYNSI